MPIIRKPPPDFATISLHDIRKEMVVGKESDFQCETHPITQEVLHLQRSYLAYLAEILVSIPADTPIEQLAKTHLLSKILVCLPPDTRIEQIGQNHIKDMFSQLYQS